MDKKIWLTVIQEELGLLNQLATGMVDDVNLSKEEVELAISRSQIVAKEFEMLLKNIPAPSLQVKKEEELIVLTEPEHEVFIPAEVPLVSEKEDVVLPTEEEIINVPSAQPEVAAPIPVPGTSPESKVMTMNVTEVEPEPVQPKPFFFRHDKEEHSALNLEMKKEEFSLFKATPLKSLKEGLILNDRYLFQRELFNNDKSRLDETIAALDRLTNIHEAVEYMKANFRWTKSEASEKFVRLVKRRFS